MSWHSTKRPTCPECGQEHLDHMDWDQEGTTHCDECGFFFAWSREVVYENLTPVMTYSTWNPKPS